MERALEMLSEMVIRGSLEESECENSNNNGSVTRSNQFDDDNLPFHKRYPIIGPDGKRYKKDWRLHLHKSTKKAALQRVTRDNPESVCTRSRALLKGRIPKTDPDSGIIFDQTASEADLTGRLSSTMEKCFTSDTKLSQRQHAAVSGPASDAVVGERERSLGKRSPSETMDLSESEDSPGSLHTVYGLSESERDLQIAKIESQVEYARQLEQHELQYRLHRGENIYDMYNRRYVDDIAEVDSTEDVTRSEESISPVKIVVDKCGDDRQDS